MSEDKNNIDEQAVEQSQVEEHEEHTIADDYDPALENIRQGFSIKEFIRTAPSLVVSLVAHAILIAILGICYLPVFVDFRPDLEANNEDLEAIEDIDLFEQEDKPLELDLENTEVSMDSSMEPMETAMEVADTTPLQAVATSDFLTDFMSPEALMTSMGSATGDLSGRNNRAAAVASGGGSEASERAVAAGLQWIADHQLPNGAWSYSQLRNPACRGKCKDIAVDKANKSLVSATAMALLPMLGSGITHKEGKHRKNVKHGLDYITSNFQMKKEGASLCEKGMHPEMYHHGLTTIVVCEAAAMSRDKNLEKLSQMAILYTINCQDPVGGGWRYSPKQPGDTSGMGWNFMALKSAQMGYIDVPKPTIVKAKRFLDLVVGSEGGAKYGYLNNSNSGDGMNRDIRALTAIGLLGQMYMGWKPDNPALVRGTDYLSKWGPDAGRLYYSYYATQVMHHAGGEKWDRWNKKMRDDLVSRQVKEGHEKGSWPVQHGEHCDQGGRLLATAFSTMILEVYYRHLPLYRKTTTVDAFPLDD